jgi:hypothetical protein
VFLLLSLFLGVGEGLWRSTADAFEIEVLGLADCVVIVWDIYKYVGRLNNESGCFRLTANWSMLA